MWCFAKKNLHESCRMDRRIVMMKLIWSLGHCECDVHTVHKVSQQRLTADWLASRESDCSRMRSKVSSDWLPIYIKATRPVLEIFKLVGYFPDSPRTSTLLEWVCTYFVNVSRAVFFSSLALVFIIAPTRFIFFTDNKAMRITVTTISVRKISLCSVNIHDTENVTN